jgi:hypothetical protein
MRCSASVRVAFPRVLRHSERSYYYHGLLWGFDVESLVLSIKDDNVILEEPTSSKESYALRVHSGRESGKRRKQEFLNHPGTNSNRNPNLNVAVVRWIRGAAASAGQVHRHFQIIEADMGGERKGECALVRTRV